MQGFSRTVQQINIMKMKLIILVFLVFGSCLVGFGQKIEVDQSFVDDSTKAFILIAEQRKTIENFLAERARTEIERQSAQTLIKAYDELIKVKTEVGLEKDKIIQMYEKVINLQMAIIDSLEKKLLKPKSFFQKVLATLRDLTLIVVGLTVGRNF